MNDRVSRFLLNPLRRQYLSVARARHPGPRIVANCIPKSGTHLLMRCLALVAELELYHDGVPHMGRLREGQSRMTRWKIRRRGASLERMGRGCFMMVHWPYSEEAALLVDRLDIRMLLMIRDPRDIAVSFVEFAMRKRRHGSHAALASLPDFRSRLLAAIRGGVVPHVSGIAHEFEAYLPWIDHGACVVRFEHLVGEEGGGSRAAQVAEVRRIGMHVGIDLSGDDVDRITQHAFDPRSRTFRRGRIGDWKNHFDEELKEVCKDSVGGLLIDLGYEGDFAW